MMDNTTIGVLAVAVCGIIGAWVRSMLGRQDTLYNELVKMNAGAVDNLTKANETNTQLVDINMRLRTEWDRLTAKVYALESEMATLKTVYTETEKGLKATIEDLRSQVANLQLQVQTLTDRLAVAAEEKTELKRDNIAATGTAAEVAVVAMDAAIKDVIDSKKE